MEKYTNALINETSPYLLQHAHNPVNWIAWSDNVFEQAAKEDKLVLISVGYSACHWCHVMEHESFENEEVAQLMNQHFICVKVDREERPDVDQVYMTAVQLMTQKGGWPLNCFTLPDGRPVYGGTYFPKDQWMHILRSLTHTYEHDRAKAEEYATQLHEGIVRSELITKAQQSEAFSEEKLHELVLRWSRNFDSLEGGDTRAPKFPLPNNYEFLLHYGVAYQNEKILNHVELTLDKMAMGGIYDQIGGGFARYSVDVLWKVPHFEKMLYDNGQLLSLYSNAYKHFKKPLYKRIIFQTVAWLEREMLSNEGAFYAALDADSEGEEGKFYCWNAKQMEEVLGTDFKWVSEYYNLNQRGFWEDNKYIPLRTSSDQEFARNMGWTQEEFETALSRINERLLDERKHRVRPGTDSKCLTSWNAMTMKGLCDAYTALGDESFLHLANKVARWICKHMLKGDKLYRNYSNGNTTIPGFLEDYAHVTDAFIALYQATCDSDWLLKADALMQTTLTHFHDETSGMFFFTAADTRLIARKMELNDNVIPASNSVMAINLFKLGRYFHKEAYTAIAHQMLTNMYDGMEMYGSGYSNWARLLLYCVRPTYDVCIVGRNISTHLRDLHEYYLPHILIAGGTDYAIPMLEDKTVESETLVYVCDENTCYAPEREVEKVLKKIRVTDY